MENLLTETLEYIKCIDCVVEDILFIGSEDSGYSCSWSEFVMIADDDYDEDYGMQKVASDLIIVFSNGCKMYRFEYDGYENWASFIPFVMPNKIKPIKNIFCKIGGVWGVPDELQGGGLGNITRIE